MINSLFNRYDNIIVFDIETTGFDPKKDEIIEVATRFGFVVSWRANCKTL